jgi:hypothetical protein
MMGFTNRVFDSHFEMMVVNLLSGIKAKDATIGLQNIALIYEKANLQSLFIHNLP